MGGSTCYLVVGVGFYGIPPHLSAFFMSLDTTRTGCPPFLTGPQAPLSQNRHTMSSIQETLARPCLLHKFLSFLVGTLPSLAVSIIIFFLPVQVKRFDPRLGPWEGGTNVTIEGVNLGKTFTDIAGGITVAGMPCHPYEELYVQTRRIVCLVDSPKNSESRRGPVIVRVSNFKGESADYYEFVNPLIESIHPSRGPLSGGTQLTIRGQFMNAGSSIQAVIDPSLPCAITYTNASHAICRTSASNRLRSGELQMSFDRGVRRYTRQMYEYVDDPTIEYAESGVVSQVKVPKGIPSGGIIISVAGNNLEYIQVYTSMISM